MQLNHSKILSVGWTLVLAYAAIWAAACGLAWFIGGEPAAAHWGTLFSVGLLFTLPLAVPFFLYSGIIATQRAFAPASHKRTYWAFLACVGLASFGYLAWAASKVQWD